jgi:hypothetical protein
MILESISTEQTREEGKSNGLRIASEGEPSGDVEVLNYLRTFTNYWYEAAAKTFESGHGCDMLCPNRGESSFPVWRGF